MSGHRETPLRNRLLEAYRLGCFGCLHEFSEVRRGIGCRRRGICGRRIKKASKLAEQKGVSGLSGRGSILPEGLPHFCLCFLEFGDLSDSSPGDAGDTTLPASCCCQREVTGGYD